MNYQANADAYRENSVMGMRREDLIPLMYEHLLVGLKKASKQIEERDIEGKAASVEKASGILYELLASLNFDEGGEVASRLASLYTYFLKELTEASRTLEARRLDPLIEMVSSLHEAWVEAAEKIRTPGYQEMQETEPPTGSWE
jgi:flagellar protein FliS